MKQHKFLYMVENNALISTTPTFSITTIEQIIKNATEMLPLLTTLCHVQWESYRNFWVKDVIVKTISELKKIKNSVNCEQCEKISDLLKKYEENYASFQKIKL